VSAVAVPVSLDWARARAYGLARSRRGAATMSRQWAGSGRNVTEETSAGLSQEGGASHQDAGLIQRLLAGDEAAFMSIVDMYQAAMVRLARNYVPSREVAEEVVQETWLAVLQGLPRFEGRSSLKTWIFRILVNRAVTRGTRERRAVPFSALFDAGTDAFEPAVDPERFFGPDGRSPHGWSTPPQPWDEIPEQRLESRETMERVAAAIDTLPPSQREVITMRDVDGFSSQEVCSVLGITEVNQRVLLHRARSKVRRALAEYLTGEPYGEAS
jgi:RNA polymerase sigma-70 factor, ECF subfamily